MAKKNSALFICNNCGATSTKWAGRCGSCGSWNTIEQQLQSLVDTASQGTAFDFSKSNNEQAKELRLKTGLSDVDAVLGGGIVEGSVVLMTGQPGIGKSTLLLQIADHIAHSEKVLYVSGEESERQIKIRADRLDAKSVKELFIVNSNSADDIVATMNTGEYKLVIVDSIQTLQTKNVPTSPGSPTQLNQSTHLLMQAAKLLGVAVILVGHVTKDGDIAGPKLLEHLVDVVLSLEGDRYGGFKLLRSAKNRYGSTYEAGIFEMGDKGLSPIENPSAALLAERQRSDGSVVLATMEGSRPLLVEIQALVSPTSFGYPKRTASGLDLNRLNLLIAMMTKRTKLDLSQSDVFVNVVGGLKVTEPAVDLAICLSIASAAKGLELSEDLVVFGEVGLSGEVRRVPFIEKRMSEVKKLGFKGAIGPKTAKAPTALKQVSTIREALALALKK